MMHIRAFSFVKSFGESSGRGVNLRVRFSYIVGKITFPRMQDQGRQTRIVRQGLV